MFKNCCCSTVLLSFMASISNFVFFATCCPWIQISYNYLVIATGTSSPFPASLLQQNPEVSCEEAKNIYKEFNEAVGMLANIICSYLYWTTVKVEIDLFSEIAIYRYIFCRNVIHVPNSHCGPIFDWIAHETVTISAAFLYILLAISSPIQAHSQARSQARSP